MAADVRTLEPGFWSHDTGARILDLVSLPPSCFCSDTLEGSQDCLEISLACSGDSSDMIGTTSPGLWPA